MHAAFWFVGTGLDTTLGADMRILTTLLFLAASGPAFAHIGHIGEVAGHGHWIALGGIAIAGAIALLGARKKPKQEDAAVDEGDPEEEEAAA